MATLLNYPKPRPWSKAEYHQAIDLGWFEGQRAELINGEVLNMPPQKEPHAFAIIRMDRILRDVFPASDFVIRIQMPMSCANSEPEPDLAVVAGHFEEMNRHPSTAALVIEVSDASLQFDRTRKANLYASCEIPDYWIINLAEGRLEVRRNPIADPSNEFGHAYSEFTAYQRGDEIAPLSRPQHKIKIADLLP